jgi:hypothetical protein
MSGPRRTSSLAGLVAALVLSTGCSSGADGRAAGPARAASDAPPSAPATTTPGTTSGSASECPQPSGPGLPDGAWTGPVSINVRGHRADVRTRGTGSGALQVIVEDGRVTGGTWAVTWQATGGSSAVGMQATVVLRGGLGGTVTGSAVEPVLLGTWTITGKATFSSPVQATAPVEESGRDRARLRVRTTACDRVVGTFSRSFRSTDAWAAAGGTARWVGRRSD